MPSLARRLGAFDATMLVMGGIIGSGIFMNPSVVARHVDTWPLILGVWAAGGVIALIGAFVYAELAALRPEVGGQYAYLRDAWHPSVAFLYGWALLLVVQSGGMAAVAVTFARYTVELTGIAMPDALLAVLTLAALTAINCLGVRSGTNTQTALMLLKLVAIVMLIVIGLNWMHLRHVPGNAVWRESSPFLALAAAMTPVMFAYGGWQTASFMSGELVRPRRDLAIGLLAGVVGVITVYLLVNWACLRALGPEGLAATSTPASAVMRLALGERGAKLIAAGIAISTLGFLSQGMLTAPRVYYAMAEDRVFFQAVAKVHPRTRVPILAIALQGAAAIVIALSGTYEQILSYVVAVDFIFFGLTGLSLFVFRRRLKSEGFRTPGHPVTTAIFVIACWLVVAGTFVRSPVNSLIGLGILMAGLPVYWMWRRRKPVLLVLLLTACGPGAEVSNGRDLYLAYGCAACHGESGDGNGPSAGLSFVKPRDLRNLHLYSGPKTPEGIASTIAFGVAGGRTGMPGYPDIPKHERLAIAEYLVSLADAPRAVTADAAWVGESNPWKMSAAYLTVANPTAQKVALVGASTTAAGTVEMHEMTTTGEMMSMRKVERIDVPPNGSAHLQPGGTHLMLMNLARDLRAGDSIVLTLRFDDGSTRTVTAPVRGAGRSPGTEGSAAQLSDLPVKGPAILFFGYTHCPDACPMTMSKLARAYRLAGSEGRDIPTLFVSVDPRDTAEVLRKYLSYFATVPAKGLTGTQAQIDAVVRQFGARYEIRDNGAVDHTLSIFVLDGKGTVVQKFDPATADPREIAKALRELS